MNIDLLLKYFPALTPQQKEQFAALDGLYREWNAQINVISRQDIDALYEKHVLHSLGIAKIIQFKPGTEILDVGTGGAFPVFRWQSCSRWPTSTWSTASAKRSRWCRG